MSEPPALIVTLLALTVLLASTSVPPALMAVAPVYVVSLVNTTVPALMVAPPVNVVGFASVSVPVPFLTRVMLPAMAPAPVNV
jgi:hypothetical protein